MLLIYQGQQSGSPGHPRLAVLVVLGYGLCVVLGLLERLVEPVLLMLALDSGWLLFLAVLYCDSNSDDYRVSATPYVFTFLAIAPYMIGTAGKDSYLRY